MERKCSVCSLPSENKCGECSLILCSEKCFNTAHSDIDFIEAKRKGQVIKGAEGAFSGKARKVAKVYQPKGRVEARLIILQGIKDGTIGPVELIELERVNTTFRDVLRDNGFWRQIAVIALEQKGIDRKEYEPILSDDMNFRRYAMAVLNVISGYGNAYIDLFNPTGEYNLLIGNANDINYTAINFDSENRIIPPDELREVARFITDTVIRRVANITITQHIGLGIVRVLKKHDNSLLDIIDIAYQLLLTGEIYIRNIDTMNMRYIRSKITK